MRSVWYMAGLMVILSAVPSFGGERTGILAPPDIKKQQDAIMALLKKGNKAHQKHIVRKPGLPLLMMVSCADSRVEPEAIFDMKPGEIYTVRAFGNIVDKSILGSLEYGADNLGCHILVVMGHTHCTALAGALDEHNKPRTMWRSLNLEDLDARLQPAVEAVTDKNLSDEERWDAVVRANVINTMRTIREQSPELWQMEQDETLKIVGGIYHLDTGEVEWVKE